MLKLDAHDEALVAEATAAIKRAIAAAHMPVADRNAFQYLLFGIAIVAEPLRLSGIPLGVSVRPVASRLIKSTRTWMS
jgi:hypothetical protein